MEILFMMSKMNKFQQPVSDIIPQLQPKYRQKIVKYVSCSDSN